MLEAIRTYVFVGLIEQYGVYESSLIFTGLAYLTCYPFFLALKGIFPSRSSFFLAIYCLVATGIGSLPFWAGPELGFSFRIISTIPLLLLPFGVYYLFIILDKIGFLRFDRHSPSNLQATIFLIALFSLPVATAVDWALFKGQSICAKTGEFSILLIAFGLPAIGAFIVIFLLLIPIVGLVSIVSAAVRWLTKDRSTQPE